MASGPGSPRIPLYHAPGSRSLRVRWLLEELVLPHRLLQVGRGVEMQEYSSRFPMMPAMTDGELEMVESGAIVLYLLEQYGAGESPRSPLPPTTTPLCPHHHHH